MPKTIDKDTLVTFLRTRATIEMTAEPDDIPVRGNYVDSGDAHVDKRGEDAILERLDGGDVWAWAIVRVRATFRRYDGSDYLGACSYKDEDEFRGSDTGYYDDMVDQALENLADDMLSHVVELEEVHAELATIVRDAQDDALGLRLAQRLDLTMIEEGPEARRYDIEGGTKTARGLARTIRRWIDEDA